MTGQGPWAPPPPPPPPAPPSQPGSFPPGPSPPGSFQPGPSQPPRRSRAPLLITIAAAAALVAGGAVAFALTRGSPTTVGTSTRTHAATAQPSRSATPTVAAYTDPQGRYTAVFAGAPSYHETTSPTPVGNVPYMYAEYAGFDVDQVVGVLLLPAGATFDLARGLNGVADTAHGTVASSTPGTFQGYRSIEGVISMPSGAFFKLEVVRVGDVVYIFGTVGPVNPPADYDPFVASVHLTPH